MNSRSARIARCAETPDARRAPAPEDPAIVPTPRKRSSAAGERRLGLELAQAVVHEIRVDAMRREFDEKKMEDYTFTPVRVAHKPKRNNGTARLSPEPREEPEKTEEPGKPVGWVPGFATRIGQEIAPFMKNPPKKRAESVPRQKKSSQ
jgi:hypothetical protein